MAVLPTRQLFRHNIIMKKGWKSTLKKKRIETR